MYLLSFPGHRGYYFYSETDGGPAENFLTALDEVVLVFDRHHLRPGRPLNVLLDHVSPGPSCMKDACEIHLTTDLNHPSQAVYQFAHEYCHFNIPGQVCASLRWLEESICEMASHYCLRQLAVEVSYLTDHPALAAYAPRFRAYSDGMLAAAAAADFTDSGRLRRLASDCYRREENQTAAALLLPLFEAVPVLWKAVPCLSGVPDGFDTVNSASIWREISPPETRKALDQLRRELYLLQMNAR